MILLIDHYDSFVYTLARYVSELGGEPIVRRHDSLTLAGVAALAPSHVVLSPGPCTPAETGMSPELVRQIGATTPILGVCLGHQVIGAAYGAAIVRARRPLHGKTSPIQHDGRDLFAGLPSPFRATRYHSLVIDPTSLPDELRVTATDDAGEIMAVRHARYPVFGVQFHPESVLSEYGYHILHRFLHGDATPPALSGARADHPYAAAANAAPAPS